MVVTSVVMIAVMIAATIAVAIAVNQRIMVKLTAYCLLQGTVY